MDTRSDGRSASPDRDGSGGWTQNPRSGAWSRGRPGGAVGDASMPADGANELASGVGFAALHTFVTVFVLRRVEAGDRRSGDFLGRGSLELASLPFGTACVVPNTDRVAFFTLSAHF